MGLTEVIDGKKVVVSRIEGGRHARKKLMELGLIPGVPVRIVRKSQQGPMVLSVMGRQVALGMGMAGKVFVR